MPKLIDERTVMKLETSDKLYSESCFILTSTSINLVTSTIANASFFVIAFAMSGVHWDFFGTIYLWQLLNSLTMDSLFSFLAAVAKSGQQAQQMAIPFLMTFIIFNGFFVTIKTCPKFMLWAIYISPFYYSIQEIAVGLFNDDALGKLVLDAYGFESRPPLALAVLLGLLGLFRICQIVALKKLNNIER